MFWVGAAAGAGRNCFGQAPSPPPVIAVANVTIDTAKPGAEIDRHIYGQFAEHLGRGIYEGIWVGENSKIPNIHGYRKDVVEALRRSMCRWCAGRAAASPISTTGATASARAPSGRCGSMSIGAASPTTTASAPMNS